MIPGAPSHTGRLQKWLELKLVVFHGNFSEQAKAAYEQVG